MLRVHAYRFFKLFSAAALLALFALPQSEAHQCSDLFVGGLSSPWTQPYLAARHEGQTDREMYALLQMTLQSAKKLGLTSQEKIAVKSAILEIEMEALDHEYQERGKPAQFALAFKKFFGLTSGTFSARNGIPYDIAYSFLPIAALAKHVVYKFNPLLIWNLQEILLKSAEQHHLASAIANAEKIPEFIAEGEIKTHASVFADKVQNGESRRTWQLGRLAMPWITSLALFATVGGGPYSIVKDVARTTLVPYEQSLYHDTEFFRDTRTHVANFSAGRVLVAYLDTFARIDSRERPPPGSSRRLRDLEESGNRCPEDCNTQ